MTRTSSPPTLRDEKARRNRIRAFQRVRDFNAAWDRQHQIQALAAADLEAILRSTSQGRRRR
jgi:hypothetical protein